MNRKELDAFVEHHRLSAEDVELALKLAGARPTREETLRFATRALMLAGITSLTAGLVFFVAGNWDALRVGGRFALLEALMVAAVAVVFLRPPPQLAGRYALLAAFVITGALLALFGQTYQTGANAYELFLTWSAVALPFVLAGQWSVLWAAWVLVLNVALGLFCGFGPEGGPLWVFFSGFDLDRTVPLLSAALVNLALWALAELACWRLPAQFAAHAPPRWLRRFILAWSLSFATWAACLASAPSTQHRAAISWTVVILAIVAFHVSRKRDDVFPLALVCASVIAIVTSLIGQLGWNGRYEVVFVTLLLAAWLILSSTVSGRILMHLQRKWRAPRVSA